MKYAILLSISLGFVVSGILGIASGSTGNVWLGWISVIFFGAGIPLFAWQLFDARPRLVVDESGVLDRTLGVGVIPWNEIISAYVKSVRSMDFICLELRNSEQWVAKLSPLKRAMTSANVKLGFTELNLNLSGVAVDTNQLLELILKKAAEYGE